MKTIRTYTDINDALMAQSWLESNGVHAFIPDEFSASTIPYLSVFSGIRLQVAEEDEDKALELLDSAP